jgi:WD40 repeat protein
MLEGAFLKRSERFAHAAIFLACAFLPLAANAATEAETAAIQKGLAYLYNTQQGDGRWTVSGHDNAATGAAAFALLSQQDHWGNNSELYQAAVDKAIAYLLNTAAVINLDTRSDGVNICPDNSTSCKGIYWDANTGSTVATGVIASALATYGLTIGTNVVATTTGPLAGMTWGQIAQAITNTFAAGQSISRTGASHRGWRSSLRGNGPSDNPTTLWAVTAFIYDETAGAVTPQVVRDELKAWLSSVQNTSGAACFQSGPESCSEANTGDWLLAMRFVGYDLTNSQLQAAVAFLNTRRQSTANDGTSRNFGDPDAMFAIYHGLETVVGWNDSTAADDNNWLVKNQKSDGSWDSSSQPDDVFATALYINILGATRIPVRPYSCPSTRQFWKDTSGAWPLRSLSLGGQNYTKQELLAILSSPSESTAPSDPSLLLAGELIAAKLNRAQGSDRTISRAIADADRALREFQGKLPYHVSSSSSTGEKLLDEAKILNSYNSGSSTSACVTGNEQTKSNRPGSIQTTTQVQRPTGPASEARGSNAVALSGPADPSAGSSTPLLPFIRKGVTALAVKGDGSAIAGAGTDNRIRVWNVATGLQTLVLPPSLGLPTGLVFNPDNRTLSSVGRDSIVRLWDVVSGKEIADLAGHEQAIRAVAVSPDGRFLATAGEDTRIMLWDLASRKLNKILVGARNYINALAFSPDSRLLASGGEDARGLIFDVASGKSLFTLLGHSGAIETVAFSPDGTVLASGGQDTVIHLWNPASGQQRQVLRGHAAPIETITFSPDGKLIASGGQDTLILVWNTAAGTLNKTLTGSAGAINVLIFGSGILGNFFLASATDTGQIALWSVTTGTKLLTIAVPTAP